MPVTGSVLVVIDCQEATMYHIYKPIDSDITYAIQLSSDGANIFDSSIRHHTFVDGDFETIHQALGVYFIRQGQVNRGYGELTMRIFD
jgi:FAD synthase